MVRTTRVRVLNDTSLFDSMQLQPRQILTIGMRSWAQWSHEYLYSFPTLIREHKFGLVVVGGHVAFEKPFNFFSADMFEVIGHAEIVQERRLIIGHMRFMNGDEQFITQRLMCRPVAMSGGNSFAALPTTFQGNILDKLAPEVTDRRIERDVAKILGTLTPEMQIAEVTKPERLYRHDCEAADQWSFIEIGAHAATARECMINEAPKDLRPKLQPGLATPLQFIDIEIKRPLFLFDKTQIRTQVYLKDERLVFVHTVQSQMGGRHDHAVVVERF